MQQTNKATFNDQLLSFVWLMLFIMPNNMVLYLFVPAAFLVLYRFKNNIKPGVTPIIITLGACLAITLLINLGEDYVTTKDYFRIISLMLFLVTFARMKGDKILKPYIYIAIFFLIVTQFAFVLNISSIINIIKTYYSSEVVEQKITNYENYEIANYGISRLGGIYFNPNQYARYLELILITLLCEIKQFRKMELLLLVTLIIISITATGSRTAFVVLFIVLLSYLFFTKKISVRNIIFIGLSGLILGAAISSYLNISELRMLKIGSGMEDSLGTKISLFSGYLSAVSGLLVLLFGNLSPEILLSQYGFTTLGTDSDIGNIPILYGILFSILFIYFCIYTYRKMLPEYRVIFVILLWMLTSSIICSYRMAPLFFLVLGLYYRRSILEKQNEREN